MTKRDSDPLPKRYAEAAAGGGGGGGGEEMVEVA